VANMAMFIDGVLRSHTGSPIYQGIAMYRLLNHNNKIYLLSSDRKKDEIWLKQHNIFGIDDLIDENIPGVIDDLPFRQVEYCRSQGGGFELAITSDPELTAKLLSIGVTTLMLLHPTYLREEFRPDSRQGIKSWSDIVSEIEMQKDNFKEDPRVQD
jgi:hypothetical protein